ncbi:IkappaB kinase complex IKAP component [Sparassis latifolia]
MRNLALYKSICTSLERPADFNFLNENTRICAVAVDTDQDALYVASDFFKDGGDVTLEIWRITGGDSTQAESQNDIPNASRIATFTTPPSAASNPWTSPVPTSSNHMNEIISLRLLADTRTLALITRGGDIATLMVDEDMREVEVVGSISAGILASSWGSDDSLLALVTGRFIFVYRSLLPLNVLVFPRDDKLILMTSTFDVLCENALHPTEFGEDAPITLGWGTKQTQFHGSLGKTAAQAALDLSEVGTSPDDDGLPHISWRGDGAFFSVSVLSPSSYQAISTRRLRILRIYSREGALQSTAEPVPGLEHALSWRPSGNLIAGTQRFGPGSGNADEAGLGKGKGGRHDVVFFERNGLRHGEFQLKEWRDGHSRRKEMNDANDSVVRRWGYSVRDVGWSADSNVLSVWIEGDGGDVVQLWTIGNYHWYLKQEISAPPTLVGPGRFTSVTWHPEDALRIILTTSSEIMQRTYAWETFASSAKSPVDTGSVAVMDGVDILLTPFRTQNVPPPMSSFVHTPHLPAMQQTLQLSRIPMPIHVSFSSSRDLLAVLWESGLVELTDLRTRINGSRGRVMDTLKIWAGIINRALGISSCRQIALWIPGGELHNKSEGDAEVVHVAVLGAETNEDAHDVVCCVAVKGGEVVEESIAPMPSSNGRLVPAFTGITWQSPNGELFVVDQSTHTPISKARFPEFCFSAVQEPIQPVRGSRSIVDEDAAATNPSSLFIGLSNGGKLQVADDMGAVRTLSSNVNSFTVASGFLTFTTTAHNVQFAPIDQLTTVLHPHIAETVPALPEWETRRVERGSRIVTAVPSTMSLILQMPRGNLETINPRPFVMNIVRHEIDDGNYGKAFLACRKHRVDLNVLVQHNQAAFKERIPSFIEQIDDVDYINLFLTNLGQGPLPANDITDLCDSIRAELEKKDLNRYINSILTAHVVKTPPDHEAGLALLLRLRGSEPQLVEDAVKYIIFLVDADRLFDIALGMYDFSLVLMIAQHAQKDPREYLPFLRELRALDHHYQRFKIDDHLKRYQKALTDLSLAGSERFDEAMLYVEKHKLYDYALSLWQATEQYDSVLNVYGNWLFERRDFREAAFVFRQANKNSKALVAYEKALEWQELFELAIQVETSKDDLASMAYRVAEDLSSKKRHMDAARVLLDYAEDVRETVDVLVRGSHFSEARRIITLRAYPEFLEDLVYPGVLESRAQIAEEIGEMQDQLRKQVQRVHELRVRKVEEPDAFYGVEDMDLHNVDVMTDVSMAATTFTRYTVAPSAVSRTTSKRSSRSKRKMERKVGSGRKGTVDEEEYLLKSVTKLVGRFNTVQVDAANVLPHLFQFTEEHRAEGMALRKEVADFEKELKAAVDEIWARPPGPEDTGEGGDGAPGDTWASRMQEHERQRQTDPLEKVAKPDLAKQEWTLVLPPSGSTPS